MVKETGVRDRLSEADLLAFREFFERFRLPLRGFFVKRGCTESEGEDLAQETLLNAYRGFDRFRREASDTTWIYSIAGNVWLNHLRSQHTLMRSGHAVSIDDPEEAELAASAELGDEVSALDRLLDDERRDQLHAAIRELPEGRRNALQLRILEGMTYSDIAKLLKIEVNTVKSQIFQAKKQLGEKLTAEQGMAANGKVGR